MSWHFKNTFIISRCFWDYYLHVFQKDYAYVLKNEYNINVTWVDRPTRNPLVWFKNRKRVVDGIKVLRPWATKNEYEHFGNIDRRLFDFQITRLISRKDTNLLWSICCSHPWLTLKKEFSKSIYWPGDHFDAINEFRYYKNYDLIMPWVEIDKIPEDYNGIKFRSSTCAGKEFMEFQYTGSFSKKASALKIFNQQVCYIGGLSYERVDFSLLSDIAQAFPNVALLLGVKSDGEEKTEIAKKELIKNNSNVFIFENLSYKELAELVNESNFGIIPYRLHGQNLKICPNKFFEYSSIGKNTITTAIPSMENYSPPAKIANNNKEFIQLMTKELEKENDNYYKSQLKDIAIYASANETIKRLSKAFDLDAIK